MYLQNHHQTLSFLAQCNQPKYEVTQFDNRAIEHYNALKRLVTRQYQSHSTLGAEKAKGLPELFIFSNPSSIPIVSEVKQNDHLDQKKQAWPKPWSTTCMTKFCQLWKQHSRHNTTYCASYKVNWVRPHHRKKIQSRKVPPCILSQDQYYRTILHTAALAIGRLNHNQFLPKKSQVHDPKCKALSAGTNTDLYCNLQIYQTSNYENCTKKTLKQEFR